MTSRCLTSNHLRYSKMTRVLVTTKRPSPRIITSTKHSTVTQMLLLNNKIGLAALPLASEITQPFYSRLILANSMAEGPNLKVQSIIVTTRQAIQARRQWLRWCFWITKGLAIQTKFVNLTSHNNHFWWGAARSTRSSKTTERSMLLASCNSRNILRWWIQISSMGQARS